MLGKRSVQRRFHRLSETIDGRYSHEEIDKDSSIQPHIMSEEEIMLKYWKIMV